MKYLLILLVLGGMVVPAELSIGQEFATTTLSISICGNAIVDSGEQCDIPTETGMYSTTIAGRQCTPTCRFGPYCGDGILQTTFNEECDDANNVSGDFCSATCTIEPAGSGGGGSSGGGGGRGGSNTDLGDSSVTITGTAYPNQQVNFLLDTRAVGSVRANSTGRFEFTTRANPGTATLGVWANDSAGVRSITLNNTFDVTQGAVTTVNGIVLPPTVALSSNRVSAGTPVTISGQAVPNSTVEIQVGTSALRTERVTSDASGRYTFSLPTSSLRNDQYPVRVRSITGTPPLQIQSNYSSTIQLLVGVDGAPSSPSDLSRDGRINLTDFSILIFWWQSAGGNSNPPADISQNGRVGLEDFSILLFNWTG